MRDPQRILRILAKFTRAWEASPDLRFGQLAENIIARSGISIVKRYQSGDTKPTDLMAAHFLFNIEDNLFESALDKWLAEPPRYIEAKPLNVDEPLRGLSAHIMHIDDYMFPPKT